MKTLFILIALLSCLSAWSQSKPVNTRDDVVETVTIQGNPVELRISDNGWITNGSSDGINYKMVSAKRYLLRYTYTQLSSTKEPERLMVDFGISAGMTCQKFGQIDLADAQKALPTEKPTLDLQTYTSVFPGEVRLGCQVVISIKGNRPE